MNIYTQESFSELEVLNKPKRHVSNRALLACQAVCKINNRVGSSLSLTDKDSNGIYHSLLFYVDYVDSEGINRDKCWQVSLDLKNPLKALKRKIKNS